MHRCILFQIKTQQMLYYRQLDMKSIICLGGKSNCETSCLKLNCSVLFLGDYSPLFILVF